VAAPRSTGGESPPAEEESAPWPEGSTEVPLAGVSAAGTVAEAPVVDNGRAGQEEPLPALETLVKRIPPEVREALDELFRVKFVRVQRLPASSLKR
jgi:hypothetical protein